MIDLQAGAGFPRNYELPLSNEDTSGRAASQVTVVSEPE